MILNILHSHLHNCLQIITYILMSTVVFFGFAQSFFLGFYTSAEGFQTPQEALMSMVRFTSGDVNFDSLQRTNTTLAPLLYTMALFVLSFVWTSLLLAIVITAYYSEVADVRPCAALQRIAS
jgi:F0F1-type ATP synthase membrane subunit a